VRGICHSGGVQQRAGERTIRRRAFSCGVELPNRTESPNRHGGSRRVRNTMYPDKPGSRARDHPFGCSDSGEAARQSPERRVAARASSAHKFTHPLLAPDTIWPEGRPIGSTSDHCSNIGVLGAIFYLSGRVSRGSRTGVNHVLGPHRRITVGRTHIAEGDTKNARRAAKAQGPAVAGRRSTEELVGGGNFIRVEGQPGHVTYRELYGSDTTERFGAVDGYRGGGKPVSSRELPAPPCQLVTPAAGRIPG